MTQKNTPEREAAIDAVFEIYHLIKYKIGELGYNNFIHSKEVEEYRAWLRNDKYKHRIDWFEKKYPSGLYYKDEDGTEIGVRLMVKQFLAESDAAYEPSTPTAAIDFADVQNYAEKNYPETYISEDGQSMVRLSDVFIAGYNHSPNDSVAFAEWIGDETIGSIIGEYGTRVWKLKSTGEWLGVPELYQMFKNREK